MDVLSLAQYVMINWTYGDTIHHLKKGNKSVIYLEFTFQRTLGFYFLQIYVPLTIIVMSSWVSFWLIKTNQVANINISGLVVIFPEGSRDSSKDRSRSHKCFGCCNHWVWRQDQAPGGLCYCSGCLHYHLLSPGVLCSGRVCSHQLP